MARLTYGALLLLLQAAFSCAGGGAWAGETIRMSPDLRVGATFFLEVVKSRQTDIPTRSNREGRSVSQIRVRVASASEKEYALEWRYLDTALVLPQERPGVSGSVLRELQEVIRATPYLMRFASDGQFVELSNFPEVQPQLERMVDLLGGMMAGADRAALAPLRKIYGDRQLTEQLIVKDILIYFNPMLWGESQLDHDHSYQSMLPSPFGGTGLQAVGRIRFIKADRDKVRVTMEQQIDPNGLDETVAAMANRMQKPMDAATREKMRQEFASFDIKDHVEYVVPVDVGWPESAIHSRTISTSQGREVTRIEVRRLAR